MRTQLEVRGRGSALLTRSLLLSMDPTASPGQDETPPVIDFRQSQDAAPFEEVRRVVRPAAHRRIHEPAAMSRSFGAGHQGFRFGLGDSQSGSGATRPVSATEEKSRGTGRAQTDNRGMARFSVGQYVELYPTIPVERWREYRRWHARNRSRHRRLSRRRAHLPRRIPGQREADRRTGMAPGDRPVTPTATNRQSA